MHRIADEQARRNGQSRDAWHDFAPHRRMVCEQLVRDRVPGQRRLCVLGAGNANDLDLPLLAGEFREIHLVDLDSEALAAGVSRQCADRSDRIRLHGGIDLSGVADLLAAWSPAAAPDERAIDACLRAATTAVPPLPAPFDVVASTCLLSQLIDALSLSLATAHPRYLELLFAIRDRHLRMLVELIAAGGAGVLVTDFVSSDTAPALATIGQSEFPAAAARLIEERNFFTGLNPFALRSLFASGANFRDRVEAVQLSRPWRWQLGPRTFAVCALRFRRTDVL